jgi:polysaccharide deacetylase
MKKARWCAAAIAVVCAFGQLALGSTYFVDATNGDDAADGLSQANAWKSIAKVNGSSFLPGDQILFKRGEVWRESLVPPSSGSAGNPIKFDAYGSGEAPTITGYFPLASAAWTLDSGSVWKATVTTNSMFWVQFGSIWGNKQTAKANVVANRDYYFATNTLYVYSQGNPASYYGSVAAMLMANGQLIYINGKSWVDLQHFKLTFYDTYGLRIGGAADHLNIANVYADAQIPAGTLPHGMFVGASAAPTDINFYNVDAHRNYNGFRIDGPATLVQLKNCRAYANRNKGLEDNSGVTRYSYSHFFANNIAIMGSQDVTGGVNSGNNIVGDTWPAVTSFARYPARMTFTVDDIGLAAGAETYVNSLLPLFDARGIKISTAVVAGYATGVLPSIQSWLNSGHDINSHSWTHQYYTNTSAITVQYTGTGTAATLSISGNHLTTAITGGPGGENVNIDLAETSYDTISKVLATLNGRGVYTATLDPNCVGAVHSIALADTTSQNIKAPTSYTTLLQKDRLIPDEMSNSRNWLQANVTGLSNVKVYVYPSGLEDTQTQGWSVAAGYEGARGGLSMGAGAKEVYGTGVNLQDVTSFGTSALHGLSAQQIEAKMAALVFKASMWGYPVGLFDHKDELTPTEVGYVLDGLQKYGAVVMTNSQLMDAIYAMSRVGTTTYYVAPVQGTDADFRPTKDSPVVDAGADLGDVFRIDVSGTDQSWFGPSWEIGSWAFIGTTPYVLVVE